MWLWHDQRMYNIINTLDLLATLTTLYPTLASRLHPSLQSLLKSVTPRLTLTRSWLAGFLLMCVGTYIRASSYRELGRHFTFQLAIRNAHKLVTSGLYSVVRHPSYTGAFLVWGGAALCQLGPGSLVAAVRAWEKTSLEGHYLSIGGVGLGQAGSLAYVVLTAWLLIAIFRRIAVEDEVLRREFGEQWQAWAERTPCRLLPLLY